MKTENWQTALYKLVQATRNNKLKWKIAEIPFNSIQNWEMRQRFLTEDLEDPLELYTVDYSTDDGDTIYHRTKHVLQFIDDRGRSLWTFPEHEGIEDLLSAVQYQVGNIGDKLKRLSALD